jgi:hypothetical protein
MGTFGTVLLVLFLLMILGAHVSLDGVLLIIVIVLLVRGNRRR